MYIYIPVNIYTAIITMETLHIYIYPNPTIDSYVLQKIQFAALFAMLRAQSKCVATRTA